MSVKLGSYQLHSPAIGSAVTIEFFRDVDEEHAMRVHSSWRPILI